MESSELLFGISDSIWYRIIAGLEVLYLIYVLYVKHLLHKVIDLSFDALKKCDEIKQATGGGKEWEDFDRLVQEIIKEHKKAIKIEDKFR